MSEADKAEPKAAAEQEGTVSRFDPLFKSVTLVAGERVGLRSEPTERTYATHSDLIFNVPAEVSLKETLFDFFARVNVVEFKSENDPFTYREYVRGELRLDLRFLDSDDSDMHDYLNVVILSRLPRTFLDQAEAEGIKFETDPGRPWLYRAKVGIHYVVLVICRLLPLEPRYYSWLAFAPAGSATWQKYIRQIAQEGNKFYLDLAKNLYPEEWQEMMTDAEFEAKLQAAVEEAAKNTLPYKRDPLLKAVIALEEVEQDFPEDVDKVLSLALKPAARLRGLKPEERLAGLKPEEIVSILKPEERLEGLQLQDRLVGLTAEEKAALLKLLQQENQDETK